MLNLAVAVLGVLSLASSVNTQATTVPQCALGCARQAATLVGCAITNTPCLCKTTFTSSVLQCVRTTSCSAAEQTEVGSILAGMCAGSSSASASSSAPSGTLSSSASTTATIPFSVPGSASSTILTSVSASPPISTTFNSASSSPSSLTPPPSTSTNPPTSSASSPSSVTKNGAAGLNSANMAHAVAAGVMIGIGVFLF